jgi:hypothetical protein
MHSKNIMHRDIKVYKLLLSHKIYFLTVKVMLNYVISVLQPTANPV